ncbi:MAG: hypothetical protein ACE5KJ_07360 [Candidatus Zixiibacteriota bacterium]
MLCYLLMVISDASAIGIADAFASGIPIPEASKHLADFNMVPKIDVTNHYGFVGGAPGPAFIGRAWVPALRS